MLSNPFSPCCTTPGSATSTLMVLGHQLCLTATGGSWGGWFGTGTSQLLVPHLLHPMAPRGDLPLSPSGPLVSSSAPPQPCPAPAASRSIQHRPCLTRGPAGRGLRAPCAALLFCSSHVSPSSGGSPAAPSGLLHKTPNKKDELIPSFPEVFQEVCCAHDMAGCGVCCPVTPVWVSP